MGQQCVQSSCAVLFQVMRICQMTRCYRKACKPFDRTDRDLRTGDPKGYRLGDRAAFEVCTTDAVSAFGGGASCLGDELADLGVPNLRGCEEGNAVAFLKPELTADNEGQAGYFRRFMRSDYARQGALIRYRERYVPELLGSLHQLARMRGSQLEA